MPKQLEIVPDLPLLLFCRCPKLEILSIGSALILDVFIENVSPTRLRVLGLKGISFTPLSVLGFFRPPIFPLLTQLTLSRCSIYEGADITLARPLRTLRWGSAALKLCLRVPEY